MLINRWGLRLVGLLCLVGVALAGCKKSPAPESGSSDSASHDVSPFRIAAAKKQSENNLKQIGLAMHLFHGDMGFLPSAGSPKGAKVVGPNAFGEHGWRVQILPYVEQQNVYANIDLQQPVPDSIRQFRIKLLQSPLDNGNSSNTPYRVFVCNGAAFEYGKHLRLTDFTDGTANTILVVEAAEPVNWADGKDLLYDPKQPLPKLGVFPGGFHALMADGSVRWIPEATDEKVIRAMITRAGNELVELPGK